MLISFAIFMTFIQLLAVIVGASEGKPLATFLNMIIGIWGLVGVLSYFFV